MPADNNYARARAALKRRLKGLEYELYYKAVEHPDKGWLEIATLVGVPVPRRRTKGGLDRTDVSREIARTVRLLCKRSGAHFPRRR